MVGRTRLKWPGLARCAEKATWGACGRRGNGWWARGWLAIAGMGMGDEAASVRSTGFHGRRGDGGRHEIAGMGGKAATADVCNRQSDRGTLLLRNKYHIVIYRGKDFLPTPVAAALAEREELTKDNQNAEE
ncbi:hypothetical protein GUJ93_ZPchr0013g37448 [Zizania palustris]|uniref:Uncharacterized protein n=1 Tax=Zizania palustris TaxID=103762 RepID=A0A8J5X5G1_ZIZPA|nr:hypothetical protein GUJ93_ZPchr0013g37448 [Zizania palustris]